MTTPLGPSCLGPPGGLGNTSELATRNWMANLTGLSTNDGFKSYFVLVSLLWVLSRLKDLWGMWFPVGTSWDKSWEPRA